MMFAMKQPSEKSAVDLLMKMLALPGRSGEEKIIADFCITQLRKAGVPASAITTDNAHKKSHHGGEIGNLIVKLPGRGSLARAPRRMLMGHLDTVPICAGARPVRKGKFIHSRDAHTGLGGDDRTGAATALHTVLHLLKHKIDHPPITLLLPVQEETGLHGVRHLNVSKLGKPAFAFNFDGGSPAKITIGATGAYRMTITIEGIASHAGGAPAHGVSAITIASLAIADLHRTGWLGAISKRGKTGGKGTANVGVINAGEATNVVTPEAIVRAEMRSHDKRFRKRILNAHMDAFKAAAKKVTNLAGDHGKVSFEHALDYEAFVLRESDPVVTLTSNAIRAAGGDPITAICDGGLDANYTNSYGIPTVTLGAGQHNAHMVTEYVNLPSFIKAQEIALLLVTAD